MYLSKFHIPTWSFVGTLLDGETWNRMPGLQICERTPSFLDPPKKRESLFVCCATFPVSTKWPPMIQEKRERKERRREGAEKGRLAEKIIVIRSGGSRNGRQCLLRGRCLFPPLPFQAMESQVWPRVILLGRKRGSEDRCNGGSRANAWIHGVFRPD